MRMWRRYAGPNPLLRRCDRAEGVLISILVLVALIAVPIAASAGVEVADRGMERARIEMHTRYPGTATTLQQAPAAVPITGEVPTETVVTVAATWTSPDGATRTGIQPVAANAPAGTEIGIWTDRTGNPAPAPYQPADAIAAGVAHGIWVWLAIVAVLSAWYALIHLILNRLRYANWTREWEYLQHRCP
ncbi:MAG: hypothetical protein J2P19_07455 [Pseudonocardia sp.]|nr:hypothetical protein [Pseudonocardia sp.]